jgi:gluconolactonase
MHPHTRAAIVLVMLPVVCATLASAQAAAGRPFRIEKLDPLLDELIAPDAMPEILGDKFALTEGPVWVPEGNDGYLLFSDCAANVIYKWQRNRPVSVFLENSGFTGKDSSTPCAPPTSHLAIRTIEGCISLRVRTC